MNWLLIPFMGWVSRMCGGAPPKLPWGLDQWIYAIPYGVHAFLLSGSLWQSAGAYGTAFVDKRTGHGRGMDLGRNNASASDHGPEKLEYLILWSQKLLPAFWYDALLLALIGACGTAANAAIAWSYRGFDDACILFASGVAKAPAYMIGWFLWDHLPKKSVIIKDKEKLVLKYFPPHLWTATEIGEFLSGVFNAIGLVLTM